MTQPIWGAVLKFPADTAIRARSFAPVSAEHSLPWRWPHFQRGERTLRQRLTALRLARLRRSQPRFARHLTAPRPLHAALPCGGGRPQSSLTLTPPAVKRAYFSLLTVNLNRAIFSASCGNKTAKYSDRAMPKSPGLGEKRGWPFPGTGTGQEGAALG